MRTSHKLTSMLLSLFALFAMATMAMAADPGNVLAAGATTPVSDQAAGSVLIYNVYTSGATNPGAENTRINITNTSAADAYVHFFFVDGSNCSVADSFLCLTGNQTMSFNMSDTDPGVMGYVVAVATDANGVPVISNSLIGDEYVKFTDGFAANLGAEAIVGIALPNPAPTAADTTATLNFNGANYGNLPRVVALDHIMSRGDGNRTLFILNRINGSLLTGASTLSSIFGIVYDAIEAPFSFTGSGGCQLKVELGVGNGFPRTAPRFTTLIPAGSYGWMKLWTGADLPVLGAAINLNAAAATNGNAFNGGHNLHKLTYTNTGSYTIPVFPAGC